MNHRRAIERQIVTYPERYQDEKRFSRREIKALLDEFDLYIKERDQQESETINHVRNTMQADFDTLLDKLQDGEGSLRERVRRLEADVERLNNLQSPRQ